MVGSPSMAKDIEDTAASMLASRQGLSPSAAEFTPKDVQQVPPPALQHRPHKVYVAPVQVVVECDLATLTLEELYTSVREQLGVPEGSFELSYGSTYLPASQTKALDVGIATKSSVMYRVPGSVAAPPAAGSSGGSNQLQQLLQLAAAAPDAHIQQQLALLQQQKNAARLAAQQAQEAERLFQLQQAQLQQNLQYTLALQLNHQQQVQMSLQLGLPPPPPPPGAAGQVGTLGSPARLPHSQHAVRTPPPPHSVSVPPSSAMRCMQRSPPSVQHVSPPPMHASPSPSSSPSPGGTGSINLTAVAGKFCTFALTAVGSAALVEALRNAAATDPGTLENTIDTILQNTEEFTALVTHKCGVEVLRELLEVSTPAQRETLLLMFLPDLAEIADSQGCEVLLHVVTLVPAESPASAALLGRIGEEVFPIMTSHTARKLVVKVLTKRYPPAALAPLQDAVLAQLIPIAKESKGCVTLKRCVDLAAPDFRVSLYQKILTNAEELITDYYANYLVQYIIDTPETAHIVAQKVASQMAHYATNKMASHVIEKCMQMGSQQTMTLLVTTMLEPECLGKITKDQYGNYIVQYAIEKAPSHLVTSIKNAVLPHVAHSQFGHKIEQKIVRRLRWVNSDATGMSEDVSMSPTQEEEEPAGTTEKGDVAQEQEKPKNEAAGDDGDVPVRIGLAIEAAASEQVAVDAKEP